VLTWASEGFFQGVVNGGFSRGSQKVFCNGGAKVAKFHFNHSIGKKLFAKILMGKCQISKSRVEKSPPVSPSDAHVC